MTARMIGMVSILIAAVMVQHVTGKQDCDSPVLSPSSCDCFYEGVAYAVEVPGDVVFQWPIPPVQAKNGFNYSAGEDFDDCTLSLIDYMDPPVFGDFWLAANACYYFPTTNYASERYDVYEYGSLAFILNRPPMVPAMFHCCTDLGICN